jgi:uncharacterized protein (DUF1778 family)
MASSIPQRDERIDLRVSAELKTLLSRAASYAGMSLSTFLVSIAADKAQQVVAEHEVMTLSAKDWDSFVAALDAEDRPRPNLEQAVSRYRQRRSGHGD